jgi:5,10-methylene-tetrahydrofolate dehydrogenase/methenyl tetrahydrofolate cyclohydrolase
LKILNKIIFLPSLTKILGNSIKLSTLPLLLLTRPLATRGFSTVVSRGHHGTLFTKYSLIQSTCLFSTTAVTNNNLIDGKAIAKDIRQELKVEIQHMAEAGQPNPGLAVILVGGRRDSQTYVNMKKKACRQVGIASFGYDYDEDVTQAELLSKISELNARPDVHGILVQLPLPLHLDEHVVLEHVIPEKDVDGLHSVNVANLAMQGTHGNRAEYWDDLSNISFAVPCTPLGCLELLDRSDVDIAGKNAVVIGRSNLVGLPISLLLLHRKATVTIVHSGTKDIEEHVSRGDIVIAAAGVAHLVKSNWLKEGAVVVDVGINSVDLEPEEIKEGGKTYKLVGDVDFEAVAEKCSKITPVPGGVGPMTIAMLLRNTLSACKRSLQLSSKS